MTLPSTMANSSWRAGFPEKLVAEFLARERGAVELLGLFKQWLDVCEAGGDEEVLLVRLHSLGGEKRLDVLEGLKRHIAELVFDFALQRPRLEFFPAKGDRRFYKGGTDGFEYSFRKGHARKWRNFGGSVEH